MRRLIYSIVFPREWMYSFLIMVAWIFWKPFFFDVPHQIKSMGEICDNGIDDDGDGLIDLNDPECTCELLEPESLIPNPSFEQLNCCPSDLEQLHCAKFWIQASTPTTDFIHACGWMGYERYPPPWPFPDGNGVLGFRDGIFLRNENPQRNWKEYAGACLINPMRKGVEYRFEFYVGFVSPDISPPINISFFGTTECANLPFG